MKKTEHVLGMCLCLAQIPFPPYINLLSTQWLSLISLSHPFCRPFTVTDLRVICFMKIRGFFFSLRLWLKMSWRKEGELSFVSGPSSLCSREGTSDPQSCLVFGWKAEGDGRSWKLSPPKGSSSPGRPSHHLPWVSTLVNPLPQGQHSSGASLKATDGKWKSIWEKCPLSLSLFHPSLSKWRWCMGGRRVADCNLTPWPIQMWEDPFPFSAVILLWRISAHIPIKHNTVRVLRRIGSAH